MPDKYVNIWKSKADNAPKQSIIGSLQKLLTEKDEQLYTLQNQLNALKERMAENVNVMEEMEKKFVEQQSLIDELQQGGHSGAPMVLKPNVPAAPAIAGGDKQTVDKLRKQISELENKMYIMSQLPDHIQELEGKIEKQNKQLEQYEDNEEKLRETIRKLSGDESAEVTQELQQKVDQQAREIERLQSQIQEGGGSHDEDDASQAQIQQLSREKANFKAKVDELTTKNQELLAKLETSRKTVMNLQSSNPTPISEGESSHDQIAELNSQLTSKDQQIQELQAQLEGAGTPTSSPEELAEAHLANQKMQRQLDEAKEKLRQQQLKMEQIVDHVQKAGKGEDLAAQVADLTSQLEEVQNENASLKENLAGKEKLLAKQAGGDLITSLNSKVERLTALNKKQDEELKKLRASSSASVSVKSGPSVPQIKEIVSPSKGGDQKQSQELNQLRKQLAQKDSELSKVNKDLADAQTQLAEMKAAGPQDTGSGNMMSLLTDLQTRIKKQKEELRKKDEEIARLKSE